MVWIFFLYIGFLSCALVSGSTSSGKICKSNPCFFGGTCVPTKDGKDYDCVCVDGFYGKRCNSRNICDIKPCKNNGNCSYINEKDYSCKCPYEYTGKNCTEIDTRDPCERKTCLRGTCELINNEEDYVCHCEPGFYGRNCSTRDICVTKPCKNNGTCSSWGSEYSCKCPYGFTGINCTEIDTRDLCQREPCLAGNCELIDNGKDYICHCKKGFYGRNCSTGDICVTKPCKNNGTCSSHFSGYSCRCAYGFIGVNCTDVDTRDLCERKPCFLGNCSLIDGGKDYVCHCDEGIYGRNCTSGNICGDNPCENGATCISYDKSSYKCVCPMGFSGENCSTVEPPPCEPNPCHNGGTCITLPDSWDYACNCTDEYVGKSCNIEVTPCTSNPCRNGGSCDVRENTYVCSCSSYFKGKNCETMMINPCSQKPCKNGKCVPKQGMDENSTLLYTCECNEWFTGYNCSDYTWCTEGEGEALCAKANAGCTFDVNTEVGYCKCLDGEYFNYASKKCEKLQECWLGKQCKDPHEICIGNKCECETNYVYDQDKGTKCVPNFCENVCGKNEICSEDLQNPGNTICSCQNGYIFNGNNCVKDVFCRRGVCQQECTNLNQSCTCREGFRLKKDELSCDIKDQTICQKDCGKGICVLLEGKESCECPAAHVYINNTCIHMCKAKKLKPGICPGNICIPDAQFGFRCNCTGTLRLSKNRVTCERKSSCSEKRVQRICKSRNAICKDDYGAENGYKCVCRKGQEEDGKRICRDLCDVEKHRENCRGRQAVCYIRPDGLRTGCKCPPGLTFSTWENKCNRIAKYSYTGMLPVSREEYFKKNIWDYNKLRNDLQESVNSLYTASVIADVHSCTDSTSVCTVEMKFEWDGSDQVNRIAQPQLCSDVKSGPNKCIIPPRLALMKRKKINLFRMTDLCDRRIVDRICGERMTCTKLEDKNFRCSCGPGYSRFGEYSPTADGKSIIEMCVDINECLKEKVCLDNTRCVNNNGSYECLCKEGYIEYNTSTNVKQHECVEICNPNPCVNGICTPVGPHSYSCRCEPGRMGINCELLLSSMLKESSANTIIVGSVLGVALLLTILIFVYKLKKMKGSAHFSQPVRNIQHAPEFAQQMEMREMSHERRSDNEERRQQEMRRF